MRKIFLAGLLLVPVTVLALDFTDVSNRYADAPFVPPEAAGISVLTNIGAVQGNPDGTFAPKRGLNRAEFVKMVTLSTRPDFNTTDWPSCFPDVAADAWYASYVCYQKSFANVQGNPDGLFHPERPVNYAEALAVLGRVYAIFSEVPPGSPWYAAVREGAYSTGVGLPAMQTQMDRKLTRGEAARLISAYLAYSKAELARYRAFERGISEQRSSSSVSSSASSQSSASSVSSSSASSTSSNSSAVSTPSFPARSQFLIAGERSRVVGGATFFANLEPVLARSVEVKLMEDIDGIESMYVVDADGVELAKLSMDRVFDPTEKTFRGTVTGTYRIEKGEQKTIGVEIKMKARGEGGTSEEIVEMDTFKITFDGEWSTSGYVKGTEIGSYPQHQTAMARITSVANAQESGAFLSAGVQQQLAAFTVGGVSVPNVTLQIEDLLFQVSKTNEVTVTNWQLGIPDSNERHTCSFNNEFQIVSCDDIPAGFGTFSSGTRAFRLFGDVALASGAPDKTLQISLNLAGNLETSGAIHWTDQSGHFQWVELEQPLARSTLWK